MSLKYLWTAHYPDGSFKQPPEDVSTQDPNKSAYFDVDHSRLSLFSICDGRYMVDVRDGTFYVNGASFRMHDVPITDIKLHFARRHTHDSNGRHDIVYRIGWDAMDHNGNPIQRVMEID